MDPKPAEEPVQEAPPASTANLNKAVEETAAAEVATSETKSSAVVEVQKTEELEAVPAAEKKDETTETSSKDEPKKPQVEEPKESEDQPTGDNKLETSESEETTSKVAKVDSTNEKQENVEEEDNAEEKFEDAVDLEAKLVEVEVSTEPIKETVSQEKLPDAASQPSSIELKPSSSEDLVTLRVTESESYEIEDSPEKSPIKMATPAPRPRPGPSSAVARQLSIKSPEIETVELDDDDDDDEDGEQEPRMSRVRDDYDDEEDDDFDEDDDDYYEDPESDDQDVNRVIQEAVDEINAMDDPESGEEDKMDVSSDDEDYSDDNDEQPSVVMPKGGASASSVSGKRKRSDYSEDEEVYDEDVEDDDDEDDDEEEDDDDDVAEVIESDTKVFKRKPSQASLSMGQISVEDESDEDVQEKKKVRKVKYKSYQQKLVAGIKKRTFKLLNKRSMHVMEEGGDVLVCSDAKIVSLKSAISSVAKPKAEEATVVSKVTTDVGKDLKAKDQLANWSDASATEERSAEPPAESSGDTPKAVAVSECKKDEENKENMTIKDNAKEFPRKVEVDEKEKVKDEDRRRDRRPARPEENEEVIDEVMDDIDDIIEDAKYQNGSKTDFNDDLTFEMDVESQPDDEDPYDDDDEDEDEEGAVDLSSYDANKSDREDYGKQSQTDESDAVELIDSSPEKSSSASSVAKPMRKPGPLRLDRDFNSSRKVSTEKPITVKKEVEDELEEKQETAKEPSVSASKSSPRKEAKLLEKTKEVETVTRKRRRSVDSDECEEEEPLVPSKKLKRELECNYKSHDRLLKEYIETTSNKTVDDVQKHTDALVVEIRTLNDMIRAKETEWNNMIHLKKVKEEILLRLTRKKHVMDIIQTKLGEVSEYTHFDSSNLSNVRSASVGPRPPTPPPEVDIRPASVTPMHSSTLNTSKNAPNTSTHSISGGRHLSLAGSKDNSLFAQFNHSNSSVTMVPLSTSSSSLITSTNTILQSRANMKSAEVAKEKSNAVQIQRQILPKPILSNHQQILNNLAMSAGLTAAAATSSGPTSISNSAPTATVASAAAAAMAANNILAGLTAQAAALLNGHHNPSGSNHLQQGNHLQVGRQGVIKDVKSIIADYRQKHPEQVPRRGRRLKNIPNTGYEGGSLTITNRSGGSSRMTELGFLLAAAENSRPSSNDSSQSNSNNQPSTPAGLSFKDVLVQFAKMSQSDRNLLSNLSSFTNAAAVAAAASTASPSATTNSSSSSQQQQQQQQQNAASHLSKGAYPEVTLHPVTNSSSAAGTMTAADMNHSAGSNSSTTHSQNNSNSTNSLLHGILTKSSSRPNATGFTSFSPTLARLLTAPERMNSQAATVTSGALANLQANTGLNLSKSNSEITITPVGASNLQQSLLAHQQQLQEQQKQLQRLREQHFLNMDDEADDSVDRLVIDEGEDHHHGASSRGDGGHHREREPSVVITTRGGNGPEFHENEVPECQGCKKREAQFVCAGCGNQWYCSRECQVNAWDDHSEICTG